MMIQATEANRVEAASPIGDLDHSNRESHRVVYQLTLLADTLALLSEESEVCQPAAKLAEVIAEQLEGQLLRVAFAFDDGTRIERVTDRECFRVLNNLVRVTAATENPAHVVFFQIVPNQQEPFRDLGIFPPPGFDVARFLLDRPPETARRDCFVSRLIAVNDRPEAVPCGLA